jgi:hypothetical protein
MQDSIAVALCKGYYVVTVTDANGCIATAGVNINGPDSIILSTQTTSVSCFGGSNGSASATVTGGIPPFRYLWSNGATTSTASNLTAGSYTLTVTDSSGCVKTNSVTIQQASPIEVTIFRQPILCFGGTTIDSVTATGGTAPYTGTGNFTRSAGANCYTVTDNRSCSVVKCDTVSQPTIVRITGFTATQILCNGGQSSVCVNATGGTGTLNYRWNTNETTMCIVRPAGSSSVRVTDQNGCSADSSTTISQPLPLVAADSARRNPTCNGGTNGSVCITATGGTLPYTGTGCYSNLSAGSYPYIVSDFNGCTDTTIVVITAPAPVTANIIYHDDVIGCQGDCNGSAFVLAGGGTPPYRYLWSNNDRSAISCDLCAGGYTVRVTDAVGCSASTSVIIDEPDTLIASITATQIACFGGSGSMSVTATGGVGPYSYLWEDGDNDTLHQQLGGSTRHTVTVMDDYGCVATDTDSILSAPDPLNITYTAPAIACWGGCTDICITVVGGTPGYNYNWNTGSTSNCTYCVRAGNDTVVVTDRNGCTATKCITITQPDPLVVTITGNPIACYGGTTTICANISGGTGPYSYRWSDNSTGGCLSSVGAGSYNVTVTDVNGCTQTAYYTVQSAPSRLTLSLSTVQILCHGQKGTVCATVGGGTTPYTYRWSNNRSTSCIDSLSPGTYWVSITDANGCVISDTATIRPEPAKLVVSANVQQILCYGGRGAINITATGGTAQLSYSWTGTNSFSSNQEDIALLLPGTYCVTVTDGNGCTATACGTINPQPDQIIITDTISSIKCFNGTGCVGVNVTGGVSPYRYLWSTGETTAIICGKFAGIYTVTVWDANNCVVGRNVVLGNAPAKLAISAVVSQPKCFGETGCLQISPSGGVTPYTYTWKKNGTPFANTKDICQLGNGVYCLQLKDSNNCTLDTCFTILSAPSQITVSKSVNQPKCFGLKGSVTLSTSGGTGTLTVNWRTCPCAVSNCPNPAPNPASLDPGTYYFTVTDANNCTVCDSVVINAPPAQIQIIDSTTQISCFGGTGCVKAIVAGGTSPYSYIWKNGTTQVGTTSQVCNLLELIALLLQTTMVVRPRSVPPSTMHRLNCMPKRPSFSRNAIWKQDVST